MALFGRIVVIIFAVLFATIAAGMVIAAGVLGPLWHGFTGDAVERIGFWVTVFFASGFTLAIGFLPLLVIICITEAVKLRSLLAYVAGAAVLMLAAYYASGSPGRFEESIDRPPPPISRESEFAIAAGVVFGFVYWAIAGRNAGAWRRSERELLESKSRSSV
jgi:hypothetical protein